MAERCLGSNLLGQQQRVMNPNAGG
jgi:hypothetical protein